MPEELTELREHAEHAKENPALVPVSVTMAALAVLVAVVALMGHRAHTEEVVLQGRAYDEWAQYQAKNIRQHEDVIFGELTTVLPATDPAAISRLRDKYSQEITRYKSEMNDLTDKAHELENEVATERGRADRFDLGEVFLEIALVITSITLLSGRRIFWLMGLVLGVLGLAVAASAYFVR